MTSAWLSIIFVTVSALLVNASNLPNDITNICASKPSTSFLNDAAEFAALDVPDAEIFGRTSGSKQRKPQVIETYFHVPAANKTLEGGWVPKSLLKEQLSVIKDSFKPVNFAFDLKGTTYNLYSNWTATGPDLTTRKKLHRDDRRTLNVYIILTFGVEFLLGSCEFPDKITQSPDGLYWLGLFPMFEGWNCTGPGDFVNDTPAQAFSAGTCTLPFVWDSCPDQPGIDPIYNYMEYTEDFCKTEFTKGQIRRMWDYAWVWIHNSSNGDFLENPNSISGSNH
ncbi:hypothetical protein IFR05_001721 [Cadophora sp. M221]|nr:hypothetical protein IFR05_001721 [Cadophora sp. M221]